MRRAHRDEATFGSVADLAGAFVGPGPRMESMQERTGERDDETWSEWYAEYIVREQSVKIRRSGSESVGCVVSTLTAAGSTRARARRAGRRGDQAEAKGTTTDGARWLDPIGGQ